MSDWVVDHKRAVNLTVLLVTTLVVSVILALGYEPAPDINPDLTVGQPSPERFVAERTTSEIDDPDKTEAARTTSENNVQAPYVINQATSQGVIFAIDNFYVQLEEGALGDPPPPTTTTTTEPVTTTTTDPGETTTTNSETTTTTVPETTTTTVPETTTTTLPRVDRDQQIVVLMQNNAIITELTVAQFVDLHEKDLDRVFEGEASVFPEMQATSSEWATAELNGGIRSQTAINEVQQKYLNPTTRPLISIVGLSEEDLAETREAMASLVARRLLINETVDETEWDIQKQIARDAVPEQTTVYRIGDLIADAGEQLTSVQIAAIQELGLYLPEVQTSVPLSALIIFGIISVLILVFLLVRIAPKNLDRPRRVVLMGIILILSAAASRVPEIVSGSDHAIGYIIPAVAIGVMTAILFDQRTALLFAIPVASFTAISTGDIAFTVYAGIAAAIPLAFVSSVSTRSQLRLSVFGAAAVAAPVAGGLEYLVSADHTLAIATQAGAWAFVGAVVGGFIGQGLVSLFESAFGITTSLSLLDLLDRNHPALQLLEEKAPGTFNHSMLVGSIAGRAARSIDADPLLAQAAAWYHDLGKTEHPQYFVENQLGYNPHDELAPQESAELIRAHVTEGLVLANQYRIPEEVANGIRMHHGTSLMRYFYHKALTRDPDTDPETFRHHGEKPTRKEMAIVMIADATEAAARAYAQSEQPTEEGLSKLVDTIVSEKLDDGQFDESSLTFGELTTIKREVVASLSAYYHARVEYPDFPEPTPVEGL
jgi:hypothetical protein